MPDVEKVVIVTRRTRLEELLERFVTREQARFYLEHSGVEFGPYEEEHHSYGVALSSLQAALPGGTRVQLVERSFLPTFTFGERDLVTLGPDGLVVNVAKYLATQPILAFNPDPGRIDGILLPFHIGGAQAIIRQVLRGEYRIQHITMAKAELNDGQKLYAVNDFFVGHRTHISARYRITHGRRSENHSSSGVIVSTGAGSTGWLSSVLNEAAGIVEAFGGQEAAVSLRNARRIPWDAPELCFSVREPFVSKASSADIVWGKVVAGESIELVSHMPQDGVIFSDGIEADYLAFNSGAVARIGVAERKTHLVVA